MLVTPQQLKAYREQYGEKAERPVSKWLVSIRLDRAPSGVVTPIYYTVEEYKEAVDFGFDIR